MPHARCTVIVNGVTQSRKRKLKFTLSSSFGPRGHRLRTQCTIELNFECDVRAVRNRHELFLSRKSSTKCGNGERWEEEEASVLFFCEITVKFKLVNFQTILFLSLSALFSATMELFICGGKRKFIQLSGHCANCWTRENHDSFGEMNSDFQPESISKSFARDGRKR